MVLVSSPRSRLKRHGVLYRQLFQIPVPRAPQVLCQYVHTTSPVQSVSITLPKSLSLWLNFITEGEAPSESLTSQGSALWRSESPFSQGCPAPQTTRWGGGGLLHPGLPTQYLRDAKSAHPTGLPSVRAAILVTPNNLEVLKTSALALVPCLVTIGNVLSVSIMRTWPQTVSRD